MKKLRIVISWLLTVALLLSMCVTVAFAADSATLVTTIPEDGKLSQGGTFTLSVTVPVVADAFDNATVDLKFDNTILKVTALNMPTTIGGKDTTTTEVDEANGAGAFGVTWAGSSGIIMTEPLVIKATFKVLETASVGLKSDLITIETYEFELDGTGLNLPNFNTRSVSLTITTPHVHQWATEWTSDDTHHWHECTAEGCTLTAGTANSGKDGGEKDLYNVQWAKDSAERQAGHFLDSRTKQIQNLAPLTANPPIVLCPYDAELYGHWWYEGPYWLYILFKKVYYDQCNFKLITPSEYIEKYPIMQISTPCRSSWGANGYSEVWLNQTNDYVHRHLHTAGERMIELAHMFPNEKNKLKKSALNQCARELLLAQSSDWLFIITNGTMVDYAKKRIKDHIGRFTKLYYQLKDDNLDVQFLKTISKQDCIFPEIDYMLYF